MTTQHAVTIAAEDPQCGLTLSELGQLVQAAMRADIDPDTPVLVRIGWHSQITRAAIGGRP